MSLRVLYLQPAASFGGAERQAAQVIPLLPRHGVEVVPVVGPGREIVHFLDDAGVRDYLFRDDLPRDLKAPRSPLGRCALLCEYAGAFFRLVDDLAEVARHRRCDLIFASRPFAWVASGFVGARLGMPVVWRAGTGYEHWLQPIALAQFAQRRPPRAIVFTAVSVAAALGPAVPAPGFVIHNGVDVRRFSAERALPSLRAELGLGERPVVGFVGRIAPEKGTERLVALCEKLRARSPEVRVLVAGDSGWREHFARRCADAGLAEAVRQLGFVRAVERVYATADVMVSTSSDEGCPNALLEAMALGRAVVATAVGGTREIVRDGVDGLLVAPDDLDGFCARVSALLDSPQRRARLGAAAVDRVRTHFSVEEQVRRLAEVLHWAAAEPEKESATRSAKGPGEKSANGIGRKSATGFANKSAKGFADKSANRSANHLENKPERESASCAERQRV